MTERMVNYCLAEQVAGKSRDEISSVTRYAYAGRYHAPGTDHTRRPLRQSLIVRNILDHMTSARPLM